jgi:hypothetical protein
MQPTTDNYPVFEANQVLTNAHLNQSFAYLDEQERLTRANLIGIGIVCGLNVSLDNAAVPTVILLTKGCGVTSEGYLIVEPDDVNLTSYRSYNLPENIAYPPFQNTNLWELFPDGEPETSALTSPAGFLNDKAVVLFLELKKEELRNCSANNCDDKGAKVTAAVRRLLIGKTELDAIIATANALAPDLPDQTLQLNLPDLRLPRYNAPATAPSTSNDVLAAFLSVFSTKKLATAMSNALTLAYQAFQPILKNTYVSNPFANFAAQFGFLDNAPVNVEQVKFLPYYYDFFDDLIHAYDEFRDKGTELLCACCPASGLFPRHLMLSLLFPASDSEARKYRHFFIASAALSGCETHTEEVVTLFRRMVEIIARFTLMPLPQPVANASSDAQIRITPSKLGDVPLSDKAIPYYYLQNGAPPLYQLWNPSLSRRLKANQNQGYRANEFTPAPPAFVTEPLAYELEPYNFLRIEGHLGKSFQTALKTLLELKAKYRLPIDIVALRTGAFDVNVAIDLTKESCRFQDLDSLYGTTRNETLCLLVKVMTYFYGIGFQTDSAVTVDSPSQFAVIKQFAPGFLVKPNTLGRLFEDYITSQGGVIPEVAPNVMAGWINIFPPVDTLVYYSFFYIIKLADALPEAFFAVNFTTLETRFKNLGIVVTAIENRREAGRSNLEGNTEVLTWEEIDDRLEDLLNSCQPDVLKAIRSDYEDRIKELKKKQFLSNFLQDHPGIQHKAGVPVGGTFIVVYHQDPSPPGFIAPLNLSAIAAGVDPVASGVILQAHRTTANFGDLVFTSIPFGVFNLSETTLANATTPINPSTIGAVLAGRAAAEAVKPQINEPQISASSLASSIKASGSATAALRTSASKFSVSDASIVADKASATGSTRASAITSNFVDATTVSIDPNLFEIKPNSPTANVGQVTVNKNLLDAIQRLQAQPLQINPDIKLVIDGLTTLIPTLPIVPIFPGTFDFATPADQIIATAVNGLADGTVIADFYLPYLCCSGCAPVQFVLPKVPPTFTVSIGCTDSNQEVAVAEVTITAKDGTPPYRIQIDEGEFQDLDNPYQLSVGEHTLTIQDADNVLSATQTVTIPDILRINNLTFACPEDGSTYVATMTISGGEPPYSVNDVLISDSSFTSSPVASGTALALRIVDQRQCILETELTHTCPPPCDLPNDGQSRRCAYRLWLQPAIDIEKYETYKQISEIKLRFNGQAINLSDSSDLLQINANALNTDFQTAMTAAVKVLNEVVNKGIDNSFGALSRPRLTIAYEPARTDPFGILWIEHFISDTFRIEFEFGLAHSLSSGNFVVRYSNEQDAAGAAFDGATFVNLDREGLETRVPAFACSDRNQCDNTDFVALCEGFDLIPAFVQSSRGRNNFTFAISENMPTTGIAAWVWEFTTSTDQLFYVGKKVAVVWNNPGGFVKLTAISDKGCFSVTLSDRR